MLVREAPRCGPAGPAGPAPPPQARRTKDGGALIVEQSQYDPAFADDDPVNFSDAGSPVPRSPLPAYAGDATDDHDEYLERLSSSSEASSVDARAESSSSDAMSGNFDRSHHYNDDQDDADHQSGHHEEYDEMIGSQGELESESDGRENEMDTSDDDKSVDNAESVEDGDDEDQEGGEEESESESEAEVNGANGAGPSREQSRRLFTSSKLDLPIHDGSKLTVKEFLLDLLRLSSRNKLSMVALENLLSWHTHKILPPGHNLPESTYSLFKLLRIDIDSFERHACVNGCQAFPPLRKRDYPEHATDKCGTCGELRFHENGRVLAPRAKFYYIPLSLQVELLKRRGAFDESMTRMCDDIREGKTTAYNSFWGAKLAEPFLMEEDMLDKFTKILVLSLGLDGVRCFKSGEYSVWPIGVKFWNLHGEDRTRKEFILLCSLVPGPTTPKKFDAYLSPLLEEIKESAKVRALFFFFFFEKYIVFSIWCFTLSFSLWCRESRFGMRVKARRRRLNFAWPRWSKTRAPCRKLQSTTVPPGSSTAGDASTQARRTPPPGVGAIKPAT